MTDESKLARREYLSTFASVGGATILAGCSSQQRGTEPEETEEIQHGIVPPDDLARRVGKIDGGGRRLNQLLIPSLALVHELNGY